MSRLPKVSLADNKTKLFERFAGFQKVNKVRLYCVSEEGLVLILAKLLL